MDSGNKRQQNAQITRKRLIDAALQLYAERSIDAVSLRQIGVAAGQKTPNALQYHFHNREGLLQAIVDEHASAVGNLREAYIERAMAGAWQPGEAAARCLVMPLVDYVESTWEGIQFVRVVSQIAAIYQDGALHQARAGIQFPENPALARVFASALSGLCADEAQRRIYLVVTNAFHSIADIYRASGNTSGDGGLARTEPLVEQLVLMLEAFFSAPPAEPR